MSLPGYLSLCPRQLGFRTSRPPVSRIARSCRATLGRFPATIRIPHTPHLLDMYALPITNGGTERSKDEAASPLHLEIETFSTASRIPRPCGELAGLGTRSSLARGHWLWTVLA